MSYLFEMKELILVKELYVDNSMKAKLYWPSEKSTAICIQMQHYSKWIPEPGELCWFMNKDRIPTLSQFVEFHEDINKYFATYPNKPNSFGAYYTKCEPFAGELPSDLKGFNYGTK